MSVVLNKAVSRAPSLFSTTSDLPSQAHSDFLRESRCVLEHTILLHRLPPLASRRCQALDNLKNEQRRGADLAGESPSRSSEIAPEAHAYISQAIGPKDSNAFCSYKVK